ncbi:collagen alpha-1(I) chain-like [Lineus longissimus]|uniref:collagen alpha-1(I) chain-like n=1 Tax=Lineus longissimus TaxID=88925 RepID=UPI00315D270C
MIEGKCCKPGQVVKDGKCGPSTPSNVGSTPGPTETPRKTTTKIPGCPKGLYKIGGTCCPQGMVPVKGGCCLPAHFKASATKCCPDGTKLIEGQCCPPGMKVSGGKCSQPPIPAPTVTAAPTPITTPSQPECPTGQYKIGNTCCPKGQVLNQGKCCPPDHFVASSTKCCPKGTKFMSGKCCPQGQKVSGGKCVTPPDRVTTVKPTIPSNECPPGHKKAPGTTTCCKIGTVFSNGRCCPKGYIASGNKCCPTGMILVQGKCCKKGQVVSGGKCTVPPTPAPPPVTTTKKVEPPNECPKGTQKSNGQCCPRGFIGAGSKCCPKGKILVQGKCCSPGQVVSSGKCSAPPTPAPEVPKTTNPARRTTPPRGGGVTTRPACPSGPGGPINGGKRTVRLDLIFILDTSSSNGQSGFGRSRQYILMLLRLFILGPSGLRLKVIYYTKHVHVLTFDVETKVKMYMNEVMSIPYMGGRIDILKIFLKVKVEFTTFFRKDIKRFLFLCGGFKVEKSQQSQLTIIIKTELILKFKIQVHYFAVGVTAKTDMVFWKTVISVKHVVTFIKIELSWVIHWFVTHSLKITGGAAGVGKIKRQHNHEAPVLSASWFLAAPYACTVLLLTDCIENSAYLASVSKILRKRVINNRVIFRVGFRKAWRRR